MTQPALAIPTRHRIRWSAGLALSVMVAAGCTPRPPGLDASEQPLALVPAKVLEAGADPSGLTAAASVEVQWLAARVAATQDHGGRGFVIVDKKNARAHVFDAKARAQTSTPVLIGAAVGDHTVPGIGTRPMHLVLPEERTTPAGRFVGESGRNTSGEDIVWVDYNAAVSMHRVRATRADEQRQVFASERPPRAREQRERSDPERAARQRHDGGRHMVDRDRDPQERTAPDDGDGERQAPFGWPEHEVLFVDRLRGQGSHSARRWPSSTNRLRRADDRTAFAGPLLRSGSTRVASEGVPRS